MIDYSDIPSFKEFFLTHGDAIGEERIVKPYLDEVFRYITKWMLADLPDGKINLSISIPPGHSKTYTACDMISYGLGVWPDSRFLYASYAAPLAEEQTDKIKSVVNSEWYQELFPEVGGAVGTKDHWKTARGGIVRGVGATGSITGFRGGLKRDYFSGAIIIDDPLKADEARSEAARKHCREWYTGTIMSRKNRSTTPTLMIAQRLHPEDLTGFIKKSFPESWYFLEIPAIVPGKEETIWPETLSYADAMKMKEIDPFTYNAQLMQNPSIPGGAMIKEEWWDYFDDWQATKSRCDTFVIFADTAYGKKESNDYSVFQYWGFEGAKCAYLFDQVRGRWSFPELKRVANEFYFKHIDCSHHAAFKPPLRMYIERKASGQSLVQEYDEFREEGVDVNAFPWDVGDYLKAGATDKVARVNQCLSAIHGGRVLLPSNKSLKWVDDFIEECSAFSWDESHTHDDMVDCLTMAVLYAKAHLWGR